MAEANKDVSTTNQSDDDRLNSEERFRVISELTSDFAYADRVEPDGTLVLEWVSDAVARVTGYTAQEISSRGLQSIIHPDDWPAVRQHVKKVLSGQSDVSETRIVTKNGEVRWLRDYSRPIWDEAQARTVRIYGASQDITEQKLAQEELSRKERELTDFVENATIGLHWVGPDGTILWANQAELDLLGYTREEYVGRNIVEFHADQQVIGDILTRLSNKETLHNYEARLRCKDGSIKCVLINSNVRWDDDRFIHTRCFTRDITGIKMAEEARAALASIVESSDDAILSKDMEGIILSWNIGAERLYGYSAEEVIGRSVSILMPPEEADDFPKIMNRLRRGEKVDHYETVRVRKDGRRLSVSLTVSPILDTSGQVVGASAIARDITERRRVEEALRASEQRFFKTFHSSPIPMSISTLSEGRFVDVNDSLLQTNGYTREEFVGRTSRELDVWVDKEVRAEMIRQVRESGTVRNLETRFRMKGGGTRTFLASVELIELEGEPCILMACNDITERKHAEEEREQLLERAQVARREAEYAQKLSAELLIREKAARNAAEEASQTKDEFLATVSHELRTPLNAIMGWATMLRRSELDEATTAKAMEAIERNAKAQTQLIEDLLDVSRIITGRMRLDVQQVELPLIIQAAVDAIRPAATARDIRLQMVLDPNAGPVSGDPGRIQQIIWNLLSNAVKFTPKGGTVQVRLERINSHVEITVSDTGQGIKPDFLPYIFDRFRQDDNSLSRVHGGLGLGLAIVRHLVELHGGRVEAQSAGEGYGSTFTVSLPITIGKNRGGFGTGALELPEATSEPSIPDRPPRLDKLRVVVVEDDPDARELLKAVLNECGAEVRSAASAAEGIELLQRQKPDVLISDIEMPYEDGYSFIRKVRALPGEQGGHIPAIALTAHARTDDRLRALSAGFDAHVTKPMDPMELVTVIASLARRVRKSEVK
jgi:PAS domain S-box-containing protein